MCLKMKILLDIFVVFFKLKEVLVLKKIGETYVANSFLSLSFPHCCRPDWSFKLKQSTK